MIYFIGAGPGDPELITLKGYKALSHCPVVITAGSLVSPDVLTHCQTDAKIYNSATMTLGEIVGVMKSADVAGSDVARLHTGEPSIYGAILEQMLLLDEAGISYEVIPGVTSLFAAAAALKCELTLPDISQTVIITRYAGRTAVPENFENIVKAGGTLCLYLSMSMLKELTARIISCGRATDTPAAVVYRASWADEKVVRGTLSNISELATGITEHAILIVGEVVAKRLATPSRLYAQDFSHKFRK
ncbi:precorrin-4 C(11)-methyltransferase [Deferribacterales bacterium RsTz2092]|nr:precorrin-4 C(11)-methyltransferase [Deferribacterales bacterium]